MKLRFRGNSLRLRLNQAEVDKLAKGGKLVETVVFPGRTSFTYQLLSGRAAEAILENGVITVTAPAHALTKWSQAEDIGLYYTLPAGEADLKIAIEKDLVCIDGPEEERDPNAFPRAVGENVC